MPWVNSIPVLTIEDGTSAWLCLANCNSDGNFLDFVGKKEDTDIHEEGFLLHEWFDLKSPATNGKKKTTTKGQSKKWIF